MDIFHLLSACIEQKASDLHLTENEPPLFRIDGHLRRTHFPPCHRDELKAMIYRLLTDEQQIEFERTHELDFAVAVPGMDRFRANIHRQRGSVEAAFRRVPQKIPALDQLGVPPIVTELAHRPNGLVLVTGPTGMGKSTTMAAVLDLINSERDGMIVCVEDPIEFVHPNKKCIVKQREVYSDTHSFAQALRHILRQDPDVIVVGEMRDLETISTTITAAETGHLVLATLHTPDAPQTLERIIDVFPSAQQQQVRLQLANCLQGVIAQLLMPHASGNGMVLATEILVATPAVRNVIRDHQIEQIPSIMQTGARHGMITMDKSIAELFKQGRITRETALSKMRFPEDFKEVSMARVK